MKQTVALLFTSLLLASCSDKQTTNPSSNPSENPTAGVKSKISYPTLESDQIMSVEDFEYTSLNRLQKRSSYGGNREILYEYDEYYYDGNGLLTKRLNYHSNIYSPTGFILLKSTSYTYSNSLLISAQDTFPQAHYSEEYKYEWNDELLLDKSFYHNGIKEYKIVFAYKDGKLQNEILTDTTGKTFSTIEYLYQGNLLIESRVYEFNGDLSKRTTLSYNNFGKLITENIEVLAMYSSSHSYVVRYEY